MYFSEPTTEAPQASTPMLGVGLLAMVAGTVLLGIFSSRVLDLASDWVLAFAVPV
jgi:hypothetical protein